MIPHAGSMALVDSVESWDARGIVCITAQHRLPTNPLREDGRLSSVHAIEFAAQAIAIHGALLAPSRPGPAFGLLASVRNCRFHCATLDEIAGVLRIDATKLATGAALAMYEFVVSGDDRRLADGRISIFMEQESGK